MDSVVRYLRAHGWARRGLSVLTVGLVIAAFGLLGYPFYTNLYQTRKQGQLSHQMASAGLKQAYRNRSIQVFRRIAASHDFPLVVVSN